MKPQNATGVPVRKDLEKAFPVAFDQGSAIGHQGKASFRDGVPSSFGLFPGQTDGDRLGMGIDHPGHLGRVEGARIFPCHRLDGDNRLVARLVGQKKPPDQVACRIDTRHSCFPLVTDGKKPPFPRQKADVFKPDSLQDRLPADGDQNGLGLRLLLSAFSIHEHEGERGGILNDRQRGHSGPHFDPHPREFAGQNIPHLRVFEGEKPGFTLQKKDPASERRKDVRKFSADRPASDNGDPPVESPESQHIGAAEDPAPVEGQSRQGTGTGACRKQNMARS